jgi:hypothetical protein
MKAKLKLDKIAIKNFFLDHAEKVVFGVVMLGVIMIVYNSMNSREKMEKQPSDLVSKVGTASAKLKQETEVEKKADELDNITKLSRVAIQDEPYQLTHYFSPPLRKLDRARGEPKILEVESLRVAAGSGLFQISAPTKAGRAGAAAGGNNELRGRKWLVVTGLVPVKKQSELFKDTFSDCRRNREASRDTTPDYRGYIVQRLEVNSPNEAKNPDWNSKKVVTLNSRKVEDAAKKEWGMTAGSAEVVEMRLTNRFVTFPLGPLSNATWDSSVAHDPEIPLFVAGAMPTPMPEEKDVKKDEKKPADPKDQFDDSAEAAPGANAAPAAGRGVGAPARPAFGGAGFMGTGGHAAAATATPTDPNALPDYYLFRFFDFSVESGKRYVYRVQLAVSNPNFEFNPVFLEKREYRDKKYLGDDVWSKSSPAMSVPYDTSTLAVAVEQPRRAVDNPIGSMIVTLWKQSTGQKVYNEFAVERGQLLNFANAEVEAAKQMMMPTTTGDAEKADLLSNVVVVDMTGGKKLPIVKPVIPEKRLDQKGNALPGKGKDRDVYSMAEILVMETDGTLSIRSEIEDIDSIKKLEGEDTSATPKGGTPGGGFGAPGGFGTPGGFGAPGGNGPGYGRGAPPPGQGGFGVPQTQPQPQKGAKPGQNGGLFDNPKDKPKNRKP